jgi:hypothetical protein
MIQTTTTMMMIMMMRNNHSLNFKSKHQSNPSFVIMP